MDRKEKQRKTKLIKLYVLFEEVFGTEEKYTEILGVYSTMKEAIKEKEKAINDNIQHYNFVLDEENEFKPEVFKNHTIIFYGYQENWNNYIEYIIIEKEVLIYE